MNSSLERFGHSLLVLFRWVALVAPIAGGVLGFAARWSHMRAFNAWMKLLNRPPVEAPSEIVWGALYSAGPWLITAMLLAITMRNRSVLMDCCRVVTLVVAWLSISQFSLPDIEMWWSAANGPFGDGLPSGDFDSRLDVVLSYPLCALTLFCFFTVRVSAQMQAAQAGHDTGG